jgi:ribosomal protein S18 acetylase RimI-like enzyme
VTESDLPCPFFNNVFSAVIPKPKVQDVVHDLIDRFLSRNVPCFWWSGPANHDQQVAGILETRGFVKAVEGAAMAIDLSSRPNFNSGGVEICEVECASQMSDWCSTCTVAFEFEDALSGWWHELFTSIPHGSPSPLRHFLASVDGKPAGTASAFVEDGVVGLASVGVRPEFRRRGIGSAITLAALRTARNQDCRLGALFSSPMAVAMYEGLGFRRHGTGHCYMWSPET